MREEERLRGALEVLISEVEGGLRDVRRIVEAGRTREPAAARRERAEDLRAVLLGLEEAARAARIAAEL